MNENIISQNLKIRQELPLWKLLCFSMFCFWQMGFIYFIGPSLTIDGKTPLPVSTDNAAVLIAAAYVVSILFMIFFPYRVVSAGRICTVAAIITLTGLFFPFDADILRLLIYMHEFICCVMIGFESFIIINFFSENCTIKHLTVAYSTAVLMIAIVQNDFFPFTFSVFKYIIAVCLVLLLIFYMSLPAKKENYPVYVKRSDNIASPKKLMTGTFILIFISALMAVSGPAIAGEAPHGVFITYLTDAVAGFIVYFLYKKVRIHPFLSISVCIALGGLGFLSMYISEHIPSAQYISCAFIGIGMLPCQMIPLYCVMLMKSYPSKVYTPMSISLALAAVLVQSLLVEAFRSIPVILNLIYCVIMIVLVFIYMHIEPHFLYSFRKKTSYPPQLFYDTPENKLSDGAHDIKTEDEKSDIDNNDVISEGEDGILSSLTKREIQVLDLIACGFSNSEIATALFISEHTVNDHTKKIYKKLNVHSRYAAAQLINNKNNEKQS